MIRAVVFAAFCAMLLLCAACGSSDDAGFPTHDAMRAAGTLEASFPDPTAIFATVDVRLQVTQVPTSTPLVPEAEVRQCTAADVSITLDGGNGYTGGGVLAYILVSNQSSSDCKLSAPPDILFTDEDGEPYPMTISGVERACPAEPFCVYQEPVLLLPNLPPHAEGAPLLAGYAQITLSWHPNGGAGTCPDRPRPPAKIVFVLPNDGGQIVQDTGIAPCNQTVGYWDYRPGHA